MSIFIHIRKPCSDYSLYLAPVVVSILLALIMTILTPPRTVYMHYEHEFSYEYRYHAQIALDDILHGNQFQTDLTRCIDCEGYADYNRWHYLFKSLLLTIPESVGLHPEASFWLVQSLPLFIAWIFLMRSFTTSADKLSIYTTALLYTYIPIRVSYLFGSSSLTNLQYAIITFTIALMIRIPTHLTKRNLSIGATLILGIIMSLTLNIGLSNLHNTYLIFGLIALIQLLRYSKKRTHLCLSYGSALLLVCLVNLPLIMSHIHHSIQIVYPNYVSTSWFDGVFLQMPELGISPLVIALFSIVWIVGIFASPHSWKLKLFLFAVYFIAANFVAGQNAPLPLSEWLFRYVPTFTTLRSMYRFNFYQIMIVTYGSYALLHRLQRSGGLAYIVRLTMAAFIVYMIGMTIRDQVQTHPHFQIPPEYAAVAEELRSLDGKKLYLPAHPHPTVDLLHAYSWSKVQDIAPRLVTYYSNPFRTIYAVPGIYQFYDLAQSPSHQLYRTLLDHERIDHSIDELIAALKKTPFHYIVLDKNYLWNTLYPHLAIDRLLSSFPVHKRLGNIVILVNTPSETCQASDQIGQSLCSQAEQLTRLESYITSRQVLVSRIHTSEYLSFIMLPQERLYLRSNDVLVSTQVKVVSGGQRDVFDFSSIIQSQRRGMIYIPLVVIQDRDYLSSPLIMTTLDNNSVHYFPNFSTQKTQMYYFTLPYLHNSKKSSIRIDTIGTQQVTFIANPYFVPDRTPDQR